MCPGESVTLTATGASSYSWSTGSSSPSIVVNPNVATTYSLIGIDINGCKKMVTYYLPITNVSINSTTFWNSCPGMQATLTAQGATNYTWSTGATTQTIFVNPTITTTYSVIGLNSTGCSDTAYFTRTVYAHTISAVSNQSVLCSGDTAWVTVYGLPNQYYNIYNSSIGFNAVVYTNPGPKSVKIAPTVTTTYTIDCTSICSVPYYITQNVVSCVGIKELNKQKNYFKIFPNPNNGEFEIKGTKEETIFISNELGQLIATKNLTQENNYSVKLSNLQSGVFFVGNKFYRQKVVVIK